MAKNKEVKKGVLLVNLGSPESSEVKDVKKYLNQFLMDGNVIDIPYLFRLFLVKGIIVPSRAKNSARLYQKIWTDEGSPLIVNSEKLTQKLEGKITAPVALAMRYGNPTVKLGLQKLIDQGVTEVLVVPLYPQYAMSTTQTVVEEVEGANNKYFSNVKLQYLPPFYSNKDYIKALANSIKPVLEKNKPEYLLFSYHGLPERHLRKTDPTQNHCLQTEDCCTTHSEAHKTCYRHQCIKTTELVAAQLNLPKESYSNAYQSRLGKDPWMQPYTSEKVKELARSGTQKLAVVTPAFVSDCLETIEEIGMEARDDFSENGGGEFTRINCLNDADEWVDWLADWVMGEVKKDGET